MLGVVSLQGRLVVCEELANGPAIEMRHRDFFFIGDFAKSCEVMQHVVLFFLILAECSSITHPRGYLY